MRELPIGSMWKAFPEGYTVTVVDIQHIEYKDYVLYRYISTDTVRLAYLPDFTLTFYIKVE